MAKYAMVVDLQRCGGCSSCITACKRENSVPADMYWCDSEKTYEGKFPMLKYEYLSTRCNHCDDAPCVSTCPRSGEAMAKRDDGLVTYNREECIKCGMCVRACPYGEATQNQKAPHEFWKSTEVTYAGVTASAQDVVDKIGAMPPYAGGGDSVREEGLIEKCTFCVNRIPDQDPACVEICPCNALVFGDLDDPNSEVSQLLDQHDAKVRIEAGKTGARSNAATGPNVYYIREYCNLKNATAK